MKNLIIITGSILFIYILLTSYALPPKAEAEEHTEQASITELSESVSIPEPSVTAPVYVLKEYEGKVAAFNIEQSKPVYISDTNVSELPQADRNLLKKGITTTDQKELKRLIEDYCS